MHPGCLVECLEDFLDIFWRDSDPSISNGDLECLGSLEKLEPLNVDRDATGDGELERIREEIKDNLANPVRVGADGGEVRVILDFENELDVFALRLHLEELETVF